MTGFQIRPGVCLDCGRVAPQIRSLIAKSPHQLTKYYPNIAEIVRSAQPARKRYGSKGKAASRSAASGERSSERAQMKFKRLRASLANLNRRLRSIPSA